MQKKHLGLQEQLKAQRLYEQLRECTANITVTLGAALVIKEAAGYVMEASYILYAARVPAKIAV